MEVTDLSTLLSTFPGSVSQERKGVRNPDTVVQGKKEELREFKLSRKLLEELPDAVEEEQKHWCLRRGKLRGWNCGDLKGEEKRIEACGTETLSGHMGKHGRRDRDYQPQKSAGG